MATSAGLGQRRERAGQALAVGLVAGGAVVQVDLFAAGMGGAFGSDRIGGDQPVTTGGQDQGDC